MNIRFIKKNEFSKTKQLAEDCFGKDEEIDNYYKNDIFANRVAVAEENGILCSMAHLKRIKADFKNGDSQLVWYILYVCTDAEKRQHGYMKKVMNFVIDTLKKEGEHFTFLVPVDNKYYINLGFSKSWDFNFDERDLLYADDGLFKCYAMSFDEKEFVPPCRLSCAANINDFKYKSFDAKAAGKFYDYFHIRPNKSYDSVPLHSLIWSEAVKTKYCILDNRCLVMRDKGEEGNPSGCLPFCKQDELPFYFKLQEQYFNEVLHVPFNAYFADSEGVEYLKSVNALDNYDIKEEPEIYDYIYFGDSLRKLSGHALSNKRNHINKFIKEYDGRWEYKTLGYDNRQEISDFLDKWSHHKSSNGIGINLGENYSVNETLKIELSGILKICECKELINKIKMGGIYIDGELAAFSVGCLNPSENMAVIEIEKALPDFDGLYQLINREFLLHEFPTVKIVNREDDLGIDGLRKSKMSYKPCMFEKRYTIVQNDYK